MLYMFIMILPIVSIITTLITMIDHCSCYMTTLTHSAKTLDARIYPYKSQVNYS